MARAEASFVALFSYATLLFAASYDVVFFRNLPGFITCIGATIMIASAVLLALREARLKAQPVRPDISS